MAETLARVHTHTHTQGNFIEIKKVEKSYLYKTYKKTDQLVI